MNKIRLSFVAIFAVIVALTQYIISGEAQQNFLALATIFTATTQTITSNAAGTPVVVPAGGNLLNLQALDVAALAGSAGSDAVAISGTKFVHQLTGADGTKGGKLAVTATASICHIMMNTTAGVAKIYPGSGGTINGGSADAAFSALTGIKPIVCCTTAADTWICA